MAEYRVCTSCERRESEMRSLRSEVERLGRARDEALNQFHLAEEWRRKLKDELAAAREALEKADRFALMAQREIMEALEGEDLQAWLGELYGASIELRDGIARAAAKGGEGSS